MTRDDIAKHRAAVQRVRDDCGPDAHALDSTSFTPFGIGTAFGHVIAMVERLADTTILVLDALDETLDRLDAIEEGASS